jgi:hypothetical protein
MALISLLGFVWTALYVGWGYQLLVAAIPFGLLSIGISRLRPHSSAPICGNLRTPLKRSRKAEGRGSRGTGKGHLFISEFR